MMQTQQVLQGRYQLKELLGQNAGRQTWLAEDLEAQPRQQVIVKLLAFSPQMQWDELKLFERESQVLKHLKHPKIPRYRDYFSVDEDTGSGLPWFGLVQDYIPGSSLRQLLDQSKRFTENQAKDIAKQVLNILIYLHELSPLVLHRDIKPSNLILGKDGQVYVVDFGAVQDRAKAEGVTFTVVGTSGYAPPEQLWGKAVPASDLYALGATLIHLLTGTAPADLPQHQMRIQFRDRVKLNPSFADWIEQLTEPAPEKRFNSAREALKALQGNSSHTPVESVAQAAKNSVRYGRLIALSLGGFILGTFVVGGMLAAIVTPPFLNSNTKSKQAEAKQYVASMNRSQQAYYVENGKFVTQDSPKGWGNLGIGIKSETQNYSYSFQGTDKAVLNYGKSKNQRLKSYVGGVFVVRDDRGDWITQSIICESNSPGQIHLAKPLNKNGFLVCAPGTRNLSNY